VPVAGWLLAAGCGFAGCVLLAGSGAGADCILAGGCGLVVGGGLATGCLPLDPESLGVV
jgi:hypothetical protein